MAAFRPNSLLSRFSPHTSSTKAFACRRLSRLWSVIRFRVCLGLTLFAFWSPELHSLPLVDPNLNYRTHRTEHFAIHYPEGYEENAIRLARLAETRHSYLEKRYQSGVDITNVILIPETDTVNAFASTYVLNRVALYVQSPAPGEFSRFDLWQDHIFTHEYTHVLNLYPYEGFTNTLVRIFAGLPPNFLSPQGLVEGFPVYEESANGKGRLHDPLTDMVVRAAVQENRFPELEEILAGTYRWPLGSTPYLFGGRFVDFLRNYPEFQQSGASGGLDSYFLSTQLPVFSDQRLQKLGYPEIQEIYDLFKEKETFKARNEAIEETPFRRWTNTGYSKEFLQYHQGRLFFFGALPSRYGIFSVDPKEWSGGWESGLDNPGADTGGAEPDFAEPELHSLSLFRNARSSGGFTFLSEPHEEQRSPYAITSGGKDGLAEQSPGSGQSVESRILASQESFPDYSGSRFQLYRKRGWALREVEPGHRLLFPSAAGDLIAYVKREDPFRHLMLGQIRNGYDLYNERILLSVDLHGILSNSVLSPDGSLVVALYRRKETGHPVLIGCATGRPGWPRGISESPEADPARRESAEGEDARSLLDAKGAKDGFKTTIKKSDAGISESGCAVLASTNGIIAQPSFSESGVLFASDKTGRFELYRLEKESGPWVSILKQDKVEVTQLSQSATGLFFPVATDGQLFALRYFANGYDLVSLKDSDLLARNVSPDFSRSELSADLPEFRAGFDETSTSDLSEFSRPYEGAFEIRPYFAGLLFGISAAESGVIAFDPLERHELALGLGFLEETPYFSAAYRYNRFSHSLSLSYLRSSLEKREFYCDAPRGGLIFLCLDNDYQFEYATASIDRQNPGRELDQQYSVGLNHEKHRNAAGLASAVFPEQDINLSSIFAGYGISNTVVFPESISRERGFSVYGEAAFYPQSWVILYDDYSKRKETAEFYSVQGSFELFLPFFFEHHVPYLAMNGRWTSGKNPEVYRVRLSSYMRGLVPEFAPYGRGALVFTAEYRFPLLWLSHRILSWWPSLGLRYIALAPFYDYGQSFERKIFKDTFVRSYGLYTDIGLHVFYLPIAIRLTYARGEGPAGETSYGFGILVGAGAGGMQDRNLDPFARSLRNGQQTLSGNHRNGFNPSQSHSRH